MLIAFVINSATFYLKEVFIFEYFCCTTSVIFTFKFHEQTIWNHQDFGLVKQEVIQFALEPNLFTVCTMPISDEEEMSPPWNFSWVVKNQLAAMGWPYSEQNMRFIISQGIKHLITLSPEKLPPVGKFPELNWTEIPVEEFEPPTLHQILQFIEICQESLTKNEPVGIHCRQGRGRTGVMAACFLVHFQDLAPDRAITNLRLQRPGSIETREQERIVAVYHDRLRRKK